MPAASRSRLLLVAAVLAAFALGVLLPGALARGGPEPTAVRSALAQTSSVQGAPGRTMVLSRVVVEKDPRLVRTIEAGQTARINPGQWLVEQPSDIHEAANRGRTPVVIYLATLLKKGAPPATPVTLP